MPSGFDEEHVGALPVVERVEKERDEVVVEDLLAAGHPRADPRRVRHVRQTKTAYRFVASYER